MGEHNTKEKCKMATIEELFNGGAGAPVFKFINVGDNLAGTIVDIDKRQRRNYETEELEFWPNGTPIEDVIVTVKDANGDEHRAFVKGAMFIAMRDALRNAGARIPEIGGTISITHTGLGEKTNPKFNAPKMYSVDYAKPAGVTENELADLFDK